MIRIEFPADRPDIAKVLGEALTTLGAVTNDAAAAVKSFGKAAGTVSSDLVEVDIVREDYSTKEFPAFAVFRDQVLQNIAKAYKLDYVSLVEFMDSPTAISQDAGSDDNGMFTEEEHAESEALMEATKTDLKGVPFNAEFCGKAAKPFYEYGPYSGQWKRRKGVQQEAYDSWYATHVPVNTPPQTTSDPQVDTASAFGGQQQSEQEQPAVSIPHDAGTLMAWVSEMQTAGRLTQGHVNEAYTQVGLTMMDIFESPGKTPESIAENVGRIYQLLVSWAD